MAIPTRSPAPAPAPAAELDRSLVAQIARGEEAALGALYDKYSPTLFAVAFRISGEHADAEEIVLDSWSQVWRDAARFQVERGSVIGWLIMICRSRALDLVRARKRRIRLVTDATAGDPDETPALGRPASSESRPERSERCRMVANALEALPPPQRKAIELAYFEGLSQSEIAVRLGEPLGTVKTRVRTAMQKLRDVLRPYYYESSL